MNRILKNREIRFDKLPEDFDISSLPEDVILIFDSIFESTDQESDDDFGDED